MNLRRVLTALAVLVVFTAVASAQITPASQVTCSVAAMSVPNVRSEGLAERVGDLRLQCTGGLAPANGNASDRMTLAVTFTAGLTNPSDAGSGGSDIMLVIDEPGTLSAAAATSLGITGYGPAVTPGINGVCVSGPAGQTPVLPATIQTTCPAFAFLANASAGYWATTSTAAGGTNAINAYQGVISGTGNVTVTFNNVPLVPPVTSGVFRDYRIVNARVNPAGTAGPISASVATATVVGASTLSVASGATQLATAAASLTTSVVPSPLSSCVTTALAPVLVPGASTVKANATYLKFGQNFLTAFKPRAVAVTAAGADNATTGALLNLEGPANAPAGTATAGYVEGNITVGANVVANYSESGVLQQVGAITGGLASSGTRLKAVFAGLDPKATYYISLNNVLDFSTQVGTIPATAGDNTAAPFAVLQTQAGGEIAGYAASAADVASPANANIPVAKLVVVAKGGTAEAVWEITNIKASSADTYTFALYAVYPAAAPPAVNPVGQNTTNATVALGYAPTTGTAATVPPGVTTTWIPRFTAPAAGTGFLAVLPCQTTMLFPFVSSLLAAPGSAWTTGIAIANTGADPLGTSALPAGGPCALNFYGSGAPAAVQTPNIAPGVTYTFLITDPGNVGLNVNWTGYIFAVCNFNFGHGFAFIEDNTRSMAMGYLANVLDSQSSDVQRGSFTLGEALKQ